MKIDMKEFMLKALEIYEQHKTKGPLYFAVTYEDIDRNEDIIAVKIMVAKKEKLEEWDF